MLTTILSLDPMYVFFDMDEATYLRIKRAINGARSLVKIALLRGWFGSCMDKVRGAVMIGYMKA